MGRLRHEAGQTVVLVAVLLPLFLGLGALAVDIGYWYVVKKTAQDAADAAALAAARELPSDCHDDPNCPAYARAREYVESNMPGATATPSTPYATPVGTVGAPAGSVPDPMKIVVAVEYQADTFFGRMFGVLDKAIRARAVAERLPGDDNLAIYSDYDADCDEGLRFDAAGISINGHVHSAGWFRIDSGPFWAADGTFDETSGCPASRDATAVTRFGDDPAATLPRVEARPRPMWFTPAQLGWRTGCTYDASNIEITSSTVELSEPDEVIPHDGTIPSGIYCAAESVHIDGQDLHGRLTVLAPAITVEGGGLELRSFSSDVLFFAIPNTDLTPNDGSLSEDPLCVPNDGADITLNGSGHRWRGIVFNPCGRITVNVGSGLDGGPAFEGAIVGSRVIVEGDGFEMIGRGKFEYSTALVE